MRVGQYLTKFEQFALEHHLAKYPKESSFDDILRTIKERELEWLREVQIDDDYYSMHKNYIVSSIIRMEQKLVQYFDYSKPLVTLKAKEQ